MLVVAFGGSYEFCQCSVGGTVGELELEVIEVTHTHTHTPV